MIKRFVLFITIISILINNSCTDKQEKLLLKFEINFSDNLVDYPLSGRALLVLSADTLVNPYIIPNPFNPLITIGMDFKNIQEGQKVIITEQKSDMFKTAMDDLNGYYSLRAIIDTDTTSCLINKDGILYSDKNVVYIDSARRGTFPVTVKNVMSGFGFNESDSIHLFEVESELLSDFYGSPVKIESAVVLPSSYDISPDKEYPVVFVLPGWGSTHAAPTLPSAGQYQLQRYGTSGYGMEKIFVFLNQDSRYGYHVFADSENNGPRATSFIKEFIPALEKAYRITPQPEGRFLVGQSSGAWASLWLIVNYPDQFGMAWAGSPDPVDFRDFIGHNLYASNANLFYDQNGNLTNSIRNDDIIFTNKEWSEMESVIGEGGQYQSFEAVFGGRDKNGIPEQAFNRETGKINEEVIEKWKKYDLNLAIRNKYTSNRQKLDNKINIVVAENDDFFLDGAVMMLDSSLKELGIKANIRFLIDGGHNTWTDSIRREMHARMDQIFSTGS
jgi:S-formylglutathione hydrolase FrmB